MIPTKKLLRVVAVTLAVLLVPAVGLLFSEEVNWGPADFIMAAGLVLGAGLTLEFILLRDSHLTYRLASALAVGTLFVLVWANLAVGIIGSEGNPANLLYGAVFLVALVGASLSRFQAAGLARTLLSMAVVQFLVPLAALLIWRPLLTTGDDSAQLVVALGLNGFFALLFAAAGLLYRHAHRARSTA